MKHTFRGGREVLARALRGEAPDLTADWALVLFSANDALDPTSVFGDITESTFGGYASIPAQPGDAGPIVWDGDDATVRLNDAAFIWTCTADPETIAGWVLYDVENDKLLFGEVYDVPHAITVGASHTLYVDIAVGVCG